MHLLKERSMNSNGDRRGDVAASIVVRRIGSSHNPRYADCDTS